MRRVNPTSKRALRSLGRRAFALVLWLIFALVAQSTGLPELLEAGAERAVAAQVGDQCSECPLERDGQSCPPACPQCHCAHAGLAVPVAAQSSVARASSVRAVWSAARSLRVPSPSLAGPFRPPSVALRA